MPKTIPTNERKKHTKKQNKNKNKPKHIIDIKITNKKYPCKKLCFKTKAIKKQNQFEIAFINIYRQYKKQNNSQTCQNAVNKKKNIQNIENNTHFFISLCIH